jgi:hypothetical protein
MQKIIGVLFLLGLVLGISIAGAGLASLLTNTSITHTQIHQDFSRLLAIVLIKMLEVIILYILSKKHTDIRNMQRKPSLILLLAVTIDFICLVLVFNNLSEFNEQQNHFLVLLSMGLLSITVIIFIMFELFIREESRNIDLSTNLQRMELESRFYTEIDIMYADMRAWRHDYMINLTALRALAENKETEKILDYINSIDKEPERNLITLQTGNVVLDAVVSSKLWLAQSQGIDVSLQAVYPENNPIKDNDLCAIAGNLLDNAIEACERMTEADGNKFISLAILVKGKNLVISISNSFNNDLRREGERYLTLKKERFHGLGISHVDSIVNKYQGQIIREHKHGIFETRIMLPLLPLDIEVVE